MLGLITTKSPELEDKEQVIARIREAANYVPAAAVIRRWQALSGIIGRKARVGGFLSLM